MTCRARRGRRRHASAAEPVVSFRPMDSRAYGGRMSRSGAGVGWRCRLGSALLCVLAVCHASSYDSEAPPRECAYRAADSEDAVLFCNIRTIDSLDHLLLNVSRQFEDAASLHVECSDILFFESTLTTAPPAGGKHAPPSRLRHLTIDKCKIRQIPARAFYKFTELKYLRVTTHNSEWSAMSMELHEDSFAGLNELSELQLADNNLWSTKSGTFCSLYSLKTLNLTANHLQNVKTLGFSDARDEDGVRSCNLALEVLDLSKNDLIVIADGSLSKLRSLVKLFLQDNAISALEDRALGGLSGLQVLNLSSNYLTSLPPELFLETSDIRDIYLSNNSINVLPPGLFEGLEQLQILDLSSNALTSQWVNRGTFGRLVRMVILNLSSNDLTKIDSTMFQDLYSLQVLNLDHNKLQSIAPHAFAELRNLHALTLSYNRLTSINSQIFSDLHVLSQLFIDNNIIKSVELNSFENMTSLEDLVLSDNHLSSIPASIGHLRSLKSLDIGNNNISYLERDNFHGMVELFGLRLVDNKISYIGQDAFEYLPQLQVLNLASNKIKHMSVGCFHKNINLKLVRIDGNEITSFEGIFNNLNNLVWLNMSDNKITTFDFKSFPQTLDWLDLHKNYIENFINDDMYTHVQIKLLDLSFNNITQLTVTSIPSSVEKLHLHNNQIDFIQVNSFSKLRKLSTVTLNNNKLVKVDINAFRIDHLDGNSDLPEFFISGNPFACDCSMEWIQRINYLSHTRQYPRVLDLDKASCSLVHSRARQKKTIIDMSPSDFLCPYESHCFALCHCCDFDACDCEMICPARCTCYHDITWSANVVDCSGAGYSHVPERIPMDATEIYLDGNDIQHLGNHVFIGKKKLQVLFLNNTKLEEVNNQTFKGVESLRILHLENNKLVELRGDEFNQLNNLNELYLDHNAIASVGNNTFSSMKSLSVLRIDENKLINFSPWQLLASATQNVAHVSFEGNKWSCDCKHIVKLETWLRNKSGDPEKMYCLDSDGNPTTVTIASVLSHCKEYMGSIGDPTVLKNEVSSSIFLPDNYFALFSGALIIIIVLCLICAVFYAFRHEVSDWVYTKYGVPLFKDQSCTNVDHIIDGNVNHMYDYYVISNTKDANFIYHNIISELEFRKMSTKKNHCGESSLNILTLENFSKSSKLSKRLIVVLTTNFMCNDLCDVHFRSIFYSYLKSLNRSDVNKVIFIKAVENGELGCDFGSILDKFKNVSWQEPRFWEKFVALLNSTDTMITLKSVERSVFKSSLSKTPSLRYTTMPVPHEHEGCSKQKLTNSLKLCKDRGDDGERSPNESSSSSSDNTYGELNNSNNSYMSIDRSCPRYNYDLRLTPSSGHIYSRVEEAPPVAGRGRAVAVGASGAAVSVSACGRTYFV